MRFKTLGNSNKPVAVLIHAMFISEEMFRNISVRLEATHYVIMPTLDAHSLEEHTTFLSVQDEANKIFEYLLKNDIQNIDILLGTSLGGIIAFELFMQKKITVSNIFLDGAPFICFSDFRIKFMASIFKRIAHKSAKSPDRQNILDKLYPEYSATMKKICGNMSDESIKNLAYACYSYKLPEKINLTFEQSLTFLYSTNEKAKICIPTVKKYTNCNLIVKEGYAHCGFLSKEPKAYVEMLLGDEEDNRLDKT